MLLKSKKMTSIYNNILKSKANNEKLLAILLDPDKIDWNNLALLIKKITQSPATHIFIGGSLVETNFLDDLISKIKQNCFLPVVLFPENPSQISDIADAILFLSLISGRNPGFLIELQVNAAPILKKIQLEIISTGYILVESGSEIAVERISKTTPLERDNTNWHWQQPKPEKC